jgi:dolichyl-phosphate beta-glucosyltransferase
MEWRSGCDTIVVVPCYNEARRLDLAAFDAFLNRSAGAALLFVDDGSADTTAALLEQFATQHPGRVSVQRLSRNFGKAEAVRQGMLAAAEQGSKFIGYWDADLATPLNAVNQFRELLMHRPDLSLVMGSRVAMLGRHIKRSWRRHLAGRAFATAASWVLGLVVYDTQCGAKLFRAEPAMTLLFKRRFRSRWIFDVEILARLIAAAGRAQAAQMIYECPLDRWSDVRGSQLKSSDFIHAAFDLAGIYWNEIRVAGARSAPAKSPVAQPTPQRKAA